MLEVIAKKNIPIIKVIKIKLVTCVSKFFLIFILKIMILYILSKKENNIANPGWQSVLN